MPKMNRSASKHVALARKYLALTVGCHSAAQVHVVARLGRGGVGGTRDHDDTGKFIQCRIGLEGRQLTRGARGEARQGRSEQISKIAGRVGAGNGSPCAATIYGEGTPTCICLIIPPRSHASWPAREILAGWKIRRHSLAAATDQFAILHHLTSSAITRIRSAHTSGWEGNHGNRFFGGR